MLKLQTSKPASKQALFSCHDFNIPMWLLLTLLDWSIPSSDWGNSHCHG
jgi:hypothetical protein